MMSSKPLLADHDVENVTTADQEVENVLKQLPKCAVSDAAKTLSQNSAIECQNSADPKAQENHPRLFFSNVAGPMFWRARILCFVLYGSSAVFFCCASRDIGVSFTFSVNIAVGVLSLVVALAEFQGTRDVILTVILAAEHHVMPTRFAISCPSLSLHFWFWCMTGFGLSFVSTVSMFTNAVVAAEAYTNFRTSWVDLLIVFPWIASWVHWLYAVLYTEQPAWDKTKKKKLAYEIGYDVKWSSTAHSVGLWGWESSYGESVLFLCSVAKWPSLNQLMLSLVRSKIQDLHGAETDRFGKCWQQRALRYVMVLFLAYLPYMLLHTGMVACQMLGQALRLRFVTDQKRRDMLFALACNAISVCAGDLVVIWQIRSQVMELAEQLPAAVEKTRKAVGSTLVQQCADESMKCQAVECCNECFRKKEFQYNPQRVNIIVSDAAPGGANGTYMLMTKFAGNWPVVFYKQEGTNAIIWQDRKAKMWKLSISGLEDGEEYDFMWDKAQMMEQKDQQPHTWKSKSGGSECTVEIKKVPEYHHPVCEAHRNGQEFLKEYGLSFKTRCRFPPSQLVRFHMYLFITIVLVFAALVLTGTTLHVWKIIECLR